MSFAKLYENDGDQILVMLDSDEGKPELKFYFESGEEGFGIVCLISNFKDSDEGWEKAANAFTNMNEEVAKKIVGKAKADIQEVFV